MILRIEFFFSEDVLLYGKPVSETELLRQIRRVNAVYDRENDTFVGLLCRMFGWIELCDNDAAPDYTYDRDVEKLFRNTDRR